MNSRKAIVEGLIFMAGEEGLSLLQLQSLLQEVSRTELLALLETIKEEYSHDAKGIELVEYASRYKFVTKEFVYPYGEKLFEQFKKAKIGRAHV